MCISGPFAWRMVAKLYLGVCGGGFQKNFCMLKETLQDPGGQKNVKLDCLLPLVKY